MDPITALSVASAAVSFFGFVVDLLRDTNEIRNQGQTLTAKSFEHSTKELSSYTGALKSRQSVGDRPQGSLAEHERALNALLDECSVNAQELLDLLNLLKVKADGSKWRSFVQAIETVWKRDKLDRLKKSLDECRINLPIRLLGYLNEKIDVYNAQNRKDFSDIHKSEREIVEILSINHADLLDRLSMQQMSLADHLGAQIKSGLIDAVLIFRDGDTKSLSSGIMGSGTDLQRLEDPRDFQIGKVMTTVAGTSDKAASSYFVDFDRIQRQILNCLHFRYIHDRAESIAPAHRETFEWVYRPPSDNKWSDFPNWLEQDAGCYWINGKAASGKSTLMRFISSDPRLEEHLKAWAGDMPLVTASFFFWFLGTPLQKSQVGLLRSLLFDILSKRPELIPQVMPELCREAEKFGQTLAEPIMTEVTRWFKRLKAATEGKYRVYLQIDGLDEFDGDHQVLLDLLKEMHSDTSCIKVLASSRPITACTHALSHFPSLRLQDLTYGDIRRYAEENLLQQRDDDPEWMKVIETVVEKSSGVFLWVVLVVKSLLKGLRDGDTIIELQSRLDELPSDIKDLYQDMMQRIPPEYKMQAAELMRLVLLNQKGLNGSQIFTPLTTLHISFSLETWDFVLNHSRQSLSKEEMISRHASIEARLSSRCLGMIEVRKGPDGFLMSCDDNVGFIHKTAFEFLEERSTSSELRHLMSSTDFNPFVSLFVSCILLAKTDQPAEVIDCQFLGERAWSPRNRARTWPPPNGSRTWTQLKSAFCLAHLAEAMGCALDSKYLTEYDDTLQKLWNSARLFARRQIRDMSGKVKEIETTGHWANILIYPSSLQPGRGPDSLAFEQSITQRWVQAGHGNNAIPEAILHQGMALNIRNYSNKKGLALVSVLFSLPTMLRSTLQNEPIQAEEIEQITRDDASGLLECLIYRVLLLDFLGSGFTICSELDVKIVRSLVDAGADPNYCPPIVQIDKGPGGNSGRSARDISILTLFLFILAREIQRTGVVGMIDPKNIEHFVEALITGKTDLDATVKFADGSFAPPHMVGVLLNHLSNKQSANNRDALPLCATLERLQRTLQARCADKNRQPSIKTEETQSTKVSRFFRKLRLKLTGHG